MGATVWSFLSDFVPVMIDGCEEELDGPVVEAKTSAGVDDVEESRNEQKKKSKCGIV